jgi:uncharacterized protein YjbJ (UPF0337 family)
MNTPHAGPHTPSRAESKLEEVGGKIKKNLGRFLNNEEMELEGELHVRKAQAEVEAAKEAERTKGLAEEIDGREKHKLGDLVHSEQLQLEGRLEEIKGQARQKMNQ